VCVCVCMVLNLPVPCTLQVITYENEYAKHLTPHLKYPNNVWV